MDTVPRSWLGSVRFRDRDDGVQNTAPTLGLGIELDSEIEKT